MITARGLIEKPASLWREVHGFLPGKLILTRDALVFKPSPSFPQKELIFKFRDVIGLEKRTEATLRVYQTTWVHYRGLYADHTFKGSFLLIETVSTKGFKVKTWIRIWEGGTEMFNAIQRTWQRVKAVPGSNHVMVTAVQKPARHYVELFGLVPGSLALKDDRLMFIPEPSFPQKEILTDLRDVKVVQKILEPVLMSRHHGFRNIRIPSKYPGYFLYIKTRSKEGKDVEHWFKVYEGLTEMFNAIQRRWKDLKSLG